MEEGGREFQGQREDVILGKELRDRLSPEGIFFFSFFHQYWTFLLSFKASASSHRELVKCMSFKAVQDIRKESEAMKTGVMACRRSSHALHLVYYRDSINIC